MNQINKHPIIAEEREEIEKNIERVRLMAELKQDFPTLFSEEYRNKFPMPAAD